MGRFTHYHSNDTVIFRWDLSENKDNCTKWEVYRVVKNRLFTVDIAKLNNSNEVLFNVPKYRIKRFDKW